MSENSTTVKHLIVEASKLAQPWTVIDISPLMKALLEIQDEQAAALRTIQRDVELLKNGPWQTAQDYLRLAARDNQSPAQRYEYLTQARAALLSAKPLQQNKTIEQSEICYSLAVVFATLGDLAGARSYAEESWRPLYLDLPWAAGKAAQKVNGENPLKSMKNSSIGFLAALRKMPQETWATLFDESKPDYRLLRFAEYREVCNFRRLLSACERSRSLYEGLVGFKAVPHADALTTYAGSFIILAVQLISVSQAALLREELTRYARSMGMEYIGVVTDENVRMLNQTALVDYFVFQADHKSSSWVNNERYRRPFKPSGVFTLTPDSNYPPVPNLGFAQQPLTEQSFPNLHFAINNSATQFRAVIGQPKSAVEIDYGVTERQFQNIFIPGVSRRILLFDTPSIWRRNCPTPSNLPGFSRFRNGRLPEAVSRTAPFSQLPALMV